MAKTKTTSSGLIGRPTRAERTHVRRVVRLMHETLDDSPVVHDVVCGLHSGLPICCVVFFVKVMSKIRGEEDRLAYFDMFPSRRPGYVPCPKCLIDGAFVKVRPCSCDDTLDHFENEEMQRVALARGETARWVARMRKAWLAEMPVPADVEEAMVRGLDRWLDETAKLYR